MTLQHKDPGQQPKCGCPEYRISEPDELMCCGDEDGSQDVIWCNDGMDDAKM